jgi:hypothetical protein
MAIREFFKALFGGLPPVAPTSKEPPAPRKTGGWSAGRSIQRVALILGSEELRTVLREQLRPVVIAEEYEYEDHPSAPVATASEIVIVDGTPRTHARLSAEYNKILRIKKSLGKRDDLYCVIGQRKDYRKYPRGTYPNLHYFCVSEGNLDHREPDLPPTGLETIEGPRLFNFADLAPFVGGWIKERKARTGIG